MNALVLMPLILLLVAVAAGLRRVPAQRAATLRRRGRYRRTLGPGWHWTVPGLERTGLEVDMIGHHLHVRGSRLNEEAELYYQIVEPDKVGETLDAVDDWVTAQTREALVAPSSAEQLKAELNRRMSRLGLRVIRCSLHVA